MRKLMLLASAAMLLIGQSALAQGKGGGHGKGGGGGGGQAAEQGGGGGGKGRGGGHEARGQGGGGHAHQARQAGPRERPTRSAVADRGRGHRAERVVERRGKGHGAERVAEQRGRGHDVIVAERRGHGPNIRTARVMGADRVVFVDGGRPRVIPAFAPGCPPGLAKKANGCLPPGQAKKIWGDPFGTWFRYSPWYGAADDWWYMNGYAYRLDPTTRLVSAFLPLLGGGVYPGNIWPVGYNDYAIDPYYPRYYGYGPNYDYRYVDGALFAVDPRSQRIDSIAALLAGDPWAVGRPMPPGYSMYNVPPPYRDRYYDTNDDWYRYSDGYIYQVDPTTQLVSAVISLLV